MPNGCLRPHLPRAAFSHWASLGRLRFAPSPRAYSAAACQLTLITGRSSRPHPRSSGTLAAVLGQEASYSANFSAHFEIKNPGT